METPNVCYIYKNEEYRPIVIADVISLKFNKINDIPYLIIKRKYNSKIEDVYINLNNVSYFCVEYK